MFPICDNKRSHVKTYEKREKTMWYFTSSLWRITFFTRAFLFVIIIIVVVSIISFSPLYYLFLPFMAFFVCGVKHFRSTLLCVKCFANEVDLIVIQRKAGGKQDMTVSMHHIFTKNKA